MSAATAFTTVSIHAPVKGATHSSGCSPPGRRVSIHAPVKGATGRGMSMSLHCPCFNPRAREGRDRHRHASDPELVEFQSTRP